jgi:N-acetylmuramoyl-L-alanine amidase
MQIFSQRDPRWSGHALGWGPALGTIGAYGCFDTCYAMVAFDNGLGYTPATIDDLFTAKGIFVRDPTGTYDFLPDNAMDVTFPGLFHTDVYGGYRGDLIASAVPSPHTYALLWISTAAVPTHFVIAYSADGKYIADPWTGQVGTLAGYGGPAAIHKTILVTYIPPAPVPAPVPAPAPAPTPPPYAGNPNPSLRYPNSLQVPSPNFTADRRDAADPPTQPSYDLKNGYDIVFHSTDGTAIGTDQTFQNPNPGGSGPRSAHFMVTLNGNVHQYVDVKDTAWHAGNFAENTRSVGIEFEDGGNNQIARPAAQLSAGAALVAWIEGKLGPAQKYLKHNQIVATACPGNLPVDAIVAQAKAIENPPAPAPVPAPAPPPAPPLPPAPLPLPTPPPDISGAMLIVAQIQALLIKLVVALTGKR